jgi:hypothetical protein
MRRLVTVWYRKGPHGFERNHIEDGHVVQDKPTIKHPDQSGWKGATWQWEHAFLSSDTPPKLVSRFTVVGSLDTIPL